MYVWHGRKSPSAGLELIQCIDARWIESEGAQDLAGLLVMQQRVRSPFHVEVEHLICGVGSAKVIQLAQSPHLLSAVPVANVHELFVYDLQLFLISQMRRMNNTFNLPNI